MTPIKTLLAGFALLSLTALVVQASEAQRRSARVRTVMTNIALRPGGQPEGISRGPGSTMFVSRVFRGGVDKVDVTTGKVVELVPDAVGKRVAAGMDFHAGLLYVAGGGPGVSDVVPPTFVKRTVFHVYNATSGEEVVTCATPFENGFLNAATVFSGSAYFTDTVRRSIFSIPVDDVLKRRCRNVKEHRLGPDFVPESGRAPNGIDGSRLFNGIFMADFTGGAVWFFRPSSGKITRVLDDGTTPLLDGIAVRKSRMFTIAHGGVKEWRLSVGDDGAPRATFRKNLTSSALSQPTNGAFRLNHLFVVNSRFDEFPPAFAADSSTVQPDTEFWMTGFPLKQ